MIDYKVGNLVVNTKDFSNVIAKIEGAVKTAILSSPVLKEMVGLLLLIAGSVPSKYFVYMMMDKTPNRHLKKSKLKIVKTDRMNPICFTSWAIPNIQASGASEIPAIRSNYQEPDFFVIPHEGIIKNHFNSDSCMRYKISKGQMFTVLSCQSNDIAPVSFLIVLYDRSISLCRSRLSDHTAGTSCRYPQLLL